MKIERFEDIKGWASARELTQGIYAITNTQPFSKDYGLIDQIRRASISIMANIAEGFDSQSPQEFVKFLIYSRRSCSEVQSHLYVALDQKYIDQEKFAELYEKAKGTAQLINGFITYLRSLSGKQANRQTG